MVNLAFYANLYSFSGPLKHHLPLTQTLSTIFRLIYSTNYPISLSSAHFLTEPFETLVDDKFIFFPKQACSSLTFSAW